VKTSLASLVLNLVWLSCFLLLVVLPGVVTGYQAHVVPLSLARQVGAILIKILEKKPPKIKFEV
jgi:hypothetical protein